MRLTVTTIRSALPFLLAACGASTGADLATPPDGLRAPCPAPSALPARDMTQAEVEIAWGRDRDALRDCAERHALLVEFIEGQRAAR